MFGASAGEIMTIVQLTMLAGLPYTALRDAIITHPTMPEGLIPLLLAVPAKPHNPHQGNILKTLAYNECA
jgi:hypothetical protein